MHSLCSRSIVKCSIHVRTWLLLLRGVALISHSAATAAPAAFCGPIVALDSGEVSRELGRMLLNSGDDSSAPDTGLLCLQEILSLQWGPHSSSPTAVDAALESFVRSLSSNPPAQQAQEQQQGEPVAAAAAGASAAVSTGFNSSGGPGVLGLPASAGMGSLQLQQQDTAGCWDQGWTFDAAAAVTAELTQPGWRAGVPRSSSAAGLSAAGQQTAGVAASAGGCAGGVLGAGSGAAQSDGMPVIAPASWGRAGVGAVGAGSVRRVASSPSINSSAWQLGRAYRLSGGTPAHTGQGVLTGQGAEGAWGEALQAQEPAFMMDMGDQEVNWYDDSVFDQLSEMDF
jgi:hypothetical protein